MPSKTVAVIEDKEAQRAGLVFALERRGFRARGAANVTEARQVIQEIGEEIDVIVADMNLEDPVERSMTGADVCIEVRAAHPDWFPEYIILSAYSKVNYYNLALRLGAAAYLPKLKSGPAELVRHIRALALKRALRPERRAVTEQLRTITAATKNLSTAVHRLCRDVLARELNDCLGAPYVLLLTDESGTQNLATNTELPTGYQPLYTVLQTMTQGVSDLSSGYEVSQQDILNLQLPANAAEVKLEERLLGAAFVPLASLKDFCLSLGLLAPLPGEFKYPEETLPLAEVLTRYVRPIIVEQLVRIFNNLDSQRKASILKSVSRLCLLLGQDQRGVIGEGILTGHLQEESNTHHKLSTMADDLWEMGKILAGVSSAGPGEEDASVEIKGLIERAINDLEERMYLRGIRFEVEGSCTVRANRDDMYIAVVRVMQWLAQRKIETPSGVEPQITVRCFRENGTTQITFEDRSRRLADNLREQLFVPLSVAITFPAGAVLQRPAQYLPLYVAKMLVEEKYGGWLDDKSNELPGEIGHRFVMRFETAGSDAGSLDATALA